MSGSTNDTGSLFVASDAAWVAFSLLMVLFVALSTKYLYGRFLLFDGLRLRRTSRGQPLSLQSASDVGEYAMLLLNTLQVLAFAISAALPWGIQQESLAIIQLLGFNLSREQRQITVQLPFDQQVIAWLQRTGQDVAFLAHSYRDPIILFMGCVGVPAALLLLTYLVLAVLALIHGSNRCHLVHPSSQETLYYRQLPVTQKPVFLLYLLLYSTGSDDDDRTSDDDHDHHDAATTASPPTLLDSPVRTINQSHFTLVRPNKPSSSSSSSSTATQSQAPVSPLHIFGEETILSAKSVRSRAVARFETSYAFQLVHVLIDPMVAFTSLRYVVEMRVRRLRRRQERIASSVAVSSFQVVTFYLVWLARFAMLIATILSLSAVLFLTSLASLTAVALLMYILLAPTINRAFSQNFLAIRTALERLFLLPVVTFAGSLLSCTYPLDTTSRITLDRFPEIQCWVGFHWFMALSAVITINVMIFQSLGNALLKAEVLTHERYKMLPNYDTANTYIQVLIALLPVFFSQTRYLVTVHAAYVALGALDILLLIFYQPAREDHYNHIRMALSVALEWSFGVALYVALENNADPALFWIWLIGFPAALLAGYLFNWLVFYIRFECLDGRSARVSADPGVDEP